MLVLQVWLPHPLPDSLFSNIFLFVCGTNFIIQGYHDILLCFIATCLPLFPNCFERWMARRAQSVRAPAAKPDSPGSVPRTCMVEGQSEFLQVVL